MSTSVGAADVSDEAGRLPHPRWRGAQPYQASGVELRAELERQLGGGSRAPEGYNGASSAYKGGGETG